MHCKIQKFRRLTTREVKNIIMRIQIKSCDSDPIRAELLKATLSKTLPIIAKIMNSSLEEGMFASDWKTAIVRPLLKKIGLELIHSNYRPVSNLPFLSKCLQQCALTQFNDHCRKHNLMPDYQSAYRENYSCETALIKIVDDILWSMENGEVTALMALHLLVALNTVDHEILLRVLQKRFGIEGTYPRVV